MRKDSVKRQKTINRARTLIYDQHKAVSNAEVEALLQPSSYVPTMNAFSQRLLPLGFDFFKMFTVDLLHEIELGVWKSLLTHLLRILHGCGSNAVAKFNQRFRQVPTFSNSTIRKFSEDVASLKRLAARDFEDILQCCVPVFDGLLPPSCNDRVQELLFTFAYWHALAKLRLHTSATLQKLREATTKLGNQLREFKDCTANLEVFETPREFSARQRQAAARSKHKTGTSTTQPVELGCRRCELNLNTFKFYSVGDYVPNVAYLGTTDSFTTQTTELQHRKVKGHWFRTNMRDAIPQMNQIGDIEDGLEAIKRHLDKLKADITHTPVNTPDASPNTEGCSSPYDIGQSERSDDAENIVLWTERNHSDVAVKFFIKGLKQHLLSRLTSDPDATDLASIRMDFVWVRWLAYDEERPGGWSVGRLDRLKYSKCRNDDELQDAFGFIDPKCIVRASHLIPAFNSGLDRSKKTPLAQDHSDGDWKYHYVDRFVDRNMVMRYLGGAIGHFNQHAPVDENADSQATYKMDDTEEEEIEIEDNESNGAEPPLEAEDSDGGNPNDFDEEAEDGPWGAGDDAYSDGIIDEDEDFVEDLYDL
ncbi:hypothetical protein FRC07_004081 [Ceratobasidium sp. 392]|nr:hypothetical protein FRC07_004081 [Ceratobasidium sp. 392]